MTHGANPDSDALRASHERNCRRKKPYLGRQEARRGRRELQRRFGRPRMHEYRCTVCSCWHLGNPLQRSA